jgi:hypothetical protein
VNPSVHALVGKTLGTLVKRPETALLGGIISHALLDFLPHKDSKNAAWRIADAGLTLAIIASALPSPAELAGVVGALAPDLENIWWPGIEGKLFPSHRVWHHRGSMTLRVATELAVVATALLTLRSRSAASCCAGGYAAESCSPPPARFR